MKLIIDIPNWLYNAMMECKEPHYSQSLGDAVRDGTPLDEVRTEIVKAYEDATMYSCDGELSRFASRVCGILDNIGKAESEDKE